MEQSELPKNSNPVSGTGLDGGLAEHQLSGEVEKLLYESEDSQYSVLHVKDRQGLTHCVVGSITGAYPGQAIEVTGKWEFHKEHGRQLRATSYTFTLPSTPEGIAKYLSSGVIKGVGKKYAELIVKTFGGDTLGVLENASARLKEVPGLGRKRIEAIRKAWRENRDKRNIQIYMQSLGITPAYFARIYKLYGDKSVEILKENPYRLAAEVDGIGFLMADRIAEQTGIGKSDLKRLLAGVTFALSQIRVAGHVCMPREDFIRYLAELLNVEKNKAVEALDKAVEAVLAVSCISEHGETMIYEPGLLRCEIELPKLFASIVLRRSKAGISIQKIRTPDSTMFSEEQLLAVDRVGKFALSIITGGPGVGKTTVISEIVRRAKLSRLKLVLAAPTGRAAKRMSETTGCSALTIHRLLKWDPANGRFVHCRANPLSQELYVIDEASMLDLPLAVALFRAIPPGATVVIVGDPDQLPSVGPGNILNDMIESHCFPVTRLTKIFRQGDGSGIIKAAHAVNSGHSPLPERNQNGELNDFYWIEKEDPEETASVIERLLLDRIPSRFGFDPMKDIQVITPMNRGPVGTQALNERLQEKLNGHALVRFKYGDRCFYSGDRVMQTTNNYDKGIFNGDMGTIMRIDHSENRFHVRFDGQDVEYSFDESDQLNLAYAITVHKSQGSEFKAVVMPLLSQHYMMLQRNLLYTGMTRAKRLMILVGSEKAVSMAVRNAVREPRYTLLQERIRILFERIPSR